MSTKFQKIGIIGALDEEVEGLKKCCTVARVTDALSTSFAECVYGEYNLVIARAGIGKVNAAICAQYMIDNFGCDAIINVGVAGGIGKGVKINDVVVSTDCLEHDFDGGEGQSIIPRMDTSVFAADASLLAAAKGAKIATDLHFGRIVSGDQFIDSKEKGQQLVADFDALATEMEGAAIAHTCHVNSVPFLIIRSISDAADEEALDTFSANVVETADLTIDVVKGILANL